MIALYQEPKWLLFSLEGSPLNIDCGTPLTSWKTTVLLGTRDPLTPPAMLASQKSTPGLNACILGPRPVSWWLVISEGTKPQSLSFKQLGEDSRFQWRFHKRTNTNYKQMISFCFDIDFGMWLKKSTVKQLQPPCQTWCLRFDGLSYQSFKAQNSKRLNARD